MNSKRNSLVLCFCAGGFLVILVYKFQTGSYQLPSTSGEVTEELAKSDEHQHQNLNGAFPQDRQNIEHERPFEPMKMKTSRNDSFDYKSELKKLNNAKVAADDPRLVQIIRDYYIIPPSTEDYKLAKSNSLDYSMGQTPFVDSRLNYLEGGFYVECGALDGERGSNSLFFEKVRKWNGLLVEADPDNFRLLQAKHRKAFSINACLSGQPYPSILTFNKAFNLGRIVNEEGKTWIKDKHIRSNQVEVQCFPLYSMLLALNQLTVDFFSLDVEGEELNVLKTIPFKKVDIKMMTVEYVHDKQGQQGVKQFVEQQGYVSMLQMSRWDGRVNDIIFRKKGLTH